MDKNFVVRVWMSGGREFYLSADIGRDEMLRICQACLLEFCEPDEFVHRFMVKFSSKKSLRGVGVRLTHERPFLCCPEVTIDFGACAVEWVTWWDGEYELCQVTFEQFITYVFKSADGWTDLALALKS